MVTAKPGLIVGALAWGLLAGCSSSSTSSTPAISSASAVAAPGVAPARPYFYEVHGLKWGMTRQEVLKAWGPGADGDPYEYKDKAGFRFVSLLMGSLPAADVVHEDVKAVAGNENPIRFLTSVVLQPGNLEPKSQVRADLVSRFGEPLADARLAAREHCEVPRCEIFRTGECTIAEVKWLPSNSDQPERLESLTHQLGCSALVEYVPRTKWPLLGGSVRTSFAPELDEVVGKLPRGVGGASSADVVTRLGPPNLRIEEGTATLRLFYLWLDGSLYSLGFENNQLMSVLGSVKIR
jgi:hypothetical protein